MPDNVVPIQLTKKVISTQNRRSSQLTPDHLRELRNAVITASKVARFYYNYIEEAKKKDELVNIMPHDATQILGQMSNQKLYVCERLDRDDPAIVASSILWDSLTPVPSETTGHRGYYAERFLEIGTQVSALSGFNLQWILTALTLIEQLFLDPTGVMLAATYGTNCTVADKFETTMLFAKWPIVPPTLESVRLHHLEEGGPTELARGVRWFRPTIHTVNAAAELILDLERTPVRAVKNKVPTASYPVAKIRFMFDHSGILTLTDIRGVCNRIVEAKPDNLESLKQAVGNRAISDNFLLWPETKI